MKRILLLLILCIIFSCRNNSVNESYSTSPKELDKISLKGRFYSGKELKTKLNNVLNNTVVDTLTKNYILDGTEFSIEKYNPANDEFGLTQIPSNFLFLDLNNDKTDDLIFQSNGPFITDSHMFLIFLSNNENNYKLVRNTGQIIDIQIIDEFCCATDLEKARYLKVDYFDYGCCDDPWDKYITGILNISSRGRLTDKLYTISLKSINRTAERTMKIDNK